jgi:hypothetical protein
VIHLQADCPRLGLGVPGFMLRSNASNKVVGAGRICGEAGETVSARDQPPCAIGSVSPVDKAMFERMRKHATHHGSGADLSPSR